MARDPDRFADYGDLVKGQSCPRCHEFTVVYNGNYFCSNCTWAMSERKSARNTQIIIAYLIQKREEALAAGNQEQVDRMEFYLADYDGETTR